nr:cation transporter [uncultured Bacteroides sp.]
MKTRMIKLSLATLILASVIALPVNAIMQHNHNAKTTVTAPAAKTKHVQIPVKGSCELCKARIEKAAKSVKGVKMAMWEQKSQTLHLQYDPAVATPKKVMQAVAKAGHDAGTVKTTSKAYKALPSCCKYKR